MKEDQWDRIRDVASLVDEMDVICAESIHFYVGGELRELVEFALLRSPVEGMQPVINESFNLLERRAATPRFLEWYFIRPFSQGKFLMQYTKLLFRYCDFKWHRSRHGQSIQKSFMPTLHVRTVPEEVMVFVPLSRGAWAALDPPGFPGPRQNSFLPFIYAFNNPNIVIEFYFEYGLKVEAATAYHIVGVEMIKWKRLLRLRAKNYLGWTNLTVAISCCKRIVIKTPSHKQQTPFQKCCKKGEFSG
jgi:hypothetical protein